MFLHARLRPFSRHNKFLSNSARARCAGVIPSKLRCLHIFMRRIFAHEAFKVWPSIHAHLCFCVLGFLSCFDR